MLRLVVATAATLALGATAEDPCECLNWKELYASKQVLCGEGREFANDTITLSVATYARELLHEGDYDKLCQATYHKLDNNYCVNYAFYVYGKGDAKDAKQWCYVSDKCKDLNGGRKVSDKTSVPSWIPSFMNSIEVYDFVNKYLHFPTELKRNVAVKVCDAKKDKLTRDMTPMELMEMGKKLDVRIGTLTKLAYPVARDKHAGADSFFPLWEDVRDDLGRGDIKALPEAVQDAIKQKVPLVFDTDAHHSDDSQRIVKGKELYKLNSPCSGHCTLKLSASEWSFSKGKDIGEMPPDAPSPRWQEEEKKKEKEAEKKKAGEEL